MLLLGRLQRNVPQVMMLASGLGSRRDRRAIGRSASDPIVPGTPYLTAWANSGKSGKELALRLMAIRQARLEPLALIVSGRERMFNAGEKGVRNVPDTLSALRPRQVDPAGEKGDGAGVENGAGGRVNHVDPFRAAAQIPVQRADADPVALAVGQVDVHRERAAGPGSGSCRTKRSAGGGAARSARSRWQRPG